MTDIHRTQKQVSPHADPLPIGNVLADVIHALGGDVCREFFGVSRGYCGKPAHMGLCPEHRDQRAQQAGGVAR